MIIDPRHKHREVLLHFSLIATIGSSTIFKLLRGLHQEVFPAVLHVGWMELIEHHHLLNLERFYTYSTTDFMKQGGINEKVATLLVDGLKDRRLLDEELALVRDHGVHLITILDQAYPEILKQIVSPPLILYVQGHLLPTCAKRMGIVGSRKASVYAEHVLRDMIPGLVERDWQIVSGGAEGADTMAHRLTLEAGGKTIAILGSGLLQPYPNSNRELFKKIVASGGAVVSIFPLRMMPDRPHFPARNRVIAGLSLGCLVVQAAEKSGALITANYALEQGRQVFAVPGLIYEELSAGCHSLIKQGAKLVNNLNDILEEFGEAPVTAAPAAGSMQPAYKTTFTQSVIGDVVAKHQEQTYDPATRTILQYLASPASIDELVEKTGMEVDELQDCLFTLQLEGKVRQTFAGTWELV